VVVLVFSTQAIGLIVGPLAALALLGGGAGPLTWRVLLGLGAIPAAAAIWLRRTMPEPPRFQAGPGRVRRSARTGRQCRAASARPAWARSWPAAGSW
jgi:MFS family permease